MGRERIFPGLEATAGDNLRFVFAVIPEGMTICVAVYQNTPLIHAIAKTEQSMIFFKTERDRGDDADSGCCSVL